MTTQPTPNDPTGALGTESTAFRAASAVPATMGVAVSKQNAPRRRCAAAGSSGSAIGPG